MRFVDTDKTAFDGALHAAGKLENMGRYRDKNMET